jgi:hypothetical protein
MKTSVIIISCVCVVVLVIVLILILKPKGSTNSSYESTWSRSNKEILYVRLDQIIKALLKIIYPDTSINIVNSPGYQNKIDKIINMVIQKYPKDTFYNYYVNVLQLPNDSSQLSNIPDIFSVFMTYSSSATLLPDYLNKFYSFLPILLFIAKCISEIFSDYFSWSPENINYIKKHISDFNKVDNNCFINKAKSKYSLAEVVILGFFKLIFWLRNILELRNELKEFDNLLTSCKPVQSTTPSSTPSSK